MFASALARAADATMTYRRCGQRNIKSIRRRYRRKGTTSTSGATRKATTSTATFSSSEWYIGDHLIYKCL